MIINKYTRACITILFAGLLHQLVPAVSYGQQAEFNLNNYERVYVHLDRSVYVAGEFINYKAYLTGLPSGKIHGRSRVLYFALTDVSGRSLSVWRINIADGSVAGSFKIPSGIDAGIYYVGAYTNRMRNGKAGCLYTVPVIVMNLLKPVPDTLIARFSGCTGINYLSSGGEAKFNSSVSATRETYKPGEMAQLNIRIQAMQEDADSADLSVSVSLNDPFRGLTREEGMFPCLSPAGRPMTAEEPVYKPEDKRFILSGKIKSRDNISPVEGRKIILAVIDTLAPSLVCTSTSPSGEFNFYLDRSFDNRELYLQFGDDSGFNNYVWEIDRKEIKLNIGPGKINILKQEERDYLETVREIRLIEAIYSDETTRGKRMSPRQAGNFSLYPDVLIRPDDYVEFSSFREMTLNIIPSIRIVKKSNVFVLKIFNEISQSFEESSIALLNGIPFTDMNYIASLGTKEIDRIEIFRRNIMVGSMTFRGIVSIFTRDGKIPASYLARNAVMYNNLVEADELRDDMEETPGKNENYPDFRNLLYWAPGINAKVGETITLKFPVSLLKGSFTVRVRGIVDGEHPVSAETLFTVQ
jgi:hypothetical protein